MRNYVDKVFGVYKIIEKCEGKTKDGHALYKGICQECGYVRIAKISDFKDSENAKCTHLNANNEFRHGKTKWRNSRLRTIFQGTKNNCYNPNSADFKNYGAKNIKIIDTWLENPLLFEEWALTNGYLENLVLSRKDKSKDFSPENCIWIDKKDSFLNSSRTNTIEVDGAAHSGKEWAKILGLSVNSINKRVKKHGIADTVQFIRNKLNGVEADSPATIKNKRPKSSSIIIGETYGIFKVIEESSNRTKQRDKLYKVQCLVCGEIFERTSSSIRKCPQNCTHNQIRSNRACRNKTCSVCGKHISRENSSGLCQQCFRTEYKKEKIKEWKETGKTGITDEATKVPNVIREYILDKQNHKCAICGKIDFHNEMPLVFILDHVNGDASDNHEENLRFICPDCDSQLPTYKSKNKNSARKFRHKYT